MSAPTKTNEAPAPAPAAKNRRDSEPARVEGTNGSQALGTQLEELARAQEELTQEVRRLIARRGLPDEPDRGVEEREGAGRMLTAARSELLGELLNEQQEQARRQLADAARSSEEAVAGVINSITTILRTVVPAALVRPKDLIEATYAVVDQGLRVGRRLALTVGENARELTRAA